MKRRDFLRHVNSNGCIIQREGHSHTILEHTQSKKRAPLPRHREIPEPLVKVICKQLGIPRPG
ncbi:MAG: type II toxin-antitoxin system HicA family toxin [Planctomycetia bacterium]|nr:type II toxin-antitoxin system HicA family toxin [Planctomycetia bacterium]